MEHYLSVSDLEEPQAFVEQALASKFAEDKTSPLAVDRCLGMVFFNPSLRTRLSSIRAAQLLGMDTFDQNVANSWPLEFGQDSIMNGSTSEHVEEAAAVLSQYCDILAIRAFPTLNARDADYAEPIMTAFSQFATVPIVNLESATRHPLQGLADMMTIEEHRPSHKPKIVLTWAPHPRALPQSVSNSFVSWCRAMDHNLIIANPEGYDLQDAIVGDIPTTHNQNEAFEGADFVYAKNWSSYESYGEVLVNDSDWTVTQEKLALSNQGYFMHCLPVRRNVVVASDVLRSGRSLVIDQANNRTFAAYAVLNQILQDTYL